MLRFLECLRHVVVAAVLAALAPAYAESPAPSHQSAQAVAQHVQELFDMQAGAYTGKLQASIDVPDTARLPACTQLQASIPPNQRLRPRMSVPVRCLEPTAWTLYVQANLSLHGYHFLATRQINPGETLTLDDLHPVEGDLLRLSPGLASDLAQVVGRIATQRIPSGVAIKNSALRDPAAIQRGQRVRTMAQGPGFTLSGEGQALESGPPGSMIQVRTSSGQIISAIVVDATTVQVPL